MKGLASNVLAAVVFAVALVLVCGCAGKEDKAAEMLQSAEYEYMHGRYDSALDVIDSLRVAYPDVIDVRRSALDLQRKIQLIKAQERVDALEEEYKKAENDYAAVKDSFDRCGASASQALVDDVTAKRMARDSVRIARDTEIAKIRYMHKKEEESKGQE